MVGDLEVPEAQEAVRLMVSEQLADQPATLLDEQRRARVVGKSQGNLEQARDAMAEGRRIDAPHGNRPAKDGFQARHRQRAIVVAIERLSSQPQRAGDARAAVAPGAAARSLRRQTGRGLAQDRAGRAVRFRQRDCRGPVDAPVVIEAMLDEPVGRCLDRVRQTRRRHARSMRERE